MQQIEVVQSLVKVVLENCWSFTWSLQGFGVLRTYLPNEGRLNIWDSKYRVPNVSMIHTHPWDFESTIVFGSLANQRYDKTQTGDKFGMPYSRAVIKPGIGGGKVNEMPSVGLRRQPVEYYTVGDVYKQNTYEIHESSPMDGTITVNLRRRIPQDVAQVFWPLGEEWVDAMPREATSIEVADIVTRFFKSNR